MVLEIAIYYVNPAGAEAGIFQENRVNTMAADALATYVARSSSAMVLNMEQKKNRSLSWSSTRKCIIWKYFYIS